MYIFERKVEKTKLQQGRRENGVGVPSLRVSGWKVWKRVEGRCLLYRWKRERERDTDRKGKGVCKEEYIGWSDC